MNEIFSRTALLIGDKALQKLQNSRVAVFGAGGVGGACIEALVRGGVGTIDVIDNDNISFSNINRQLLATIDTVGVNKAHAATIRAKSLNPDVVVNEYPVFFTKDTASDFDFSVYDYVVDAIDTVTSKILLAEMCQSAGTPLISSMGTGNKLDPTAFEVTDIYKTSVCPLARVMRTELKKRGIKKLKVLYSKEKPIKVTVPDEQRRGVPASISFVPSTAGLIIAGEVIKDIVGVREEF